MNKYLEINLIKYVKLYMEEIIEKYLSIEKVNKFQGL